MSETTAAASRTGDPLDRAMRHIEAHRLELMTLDALAGVAGLSAYHFARAFAARFGSARWPTPGPGGWRRRPSS